MGRLHLTVVLVLCGACCSGSQTTDLASVIDAVQTLNDRISTLEQDNVELRRDLDNLVNDKSRARRQVSFPEEVGFSATISKHLTHLGYSHTILFDRILTNIGGGYDGFTGVFIAPVPGTYQFYTNVMSESGHYIETEMVKNGTQLVEMYSGGTSTFDSTSNYVVASLQKGDHVWVRVHGSWSSNFAIHCCFSTFSGYLLKLDEAGLDSVLVG